MNSKHYIMSVKAKENVRYNPLHDEIDGCEAVILEAKAGDIGWMSYKYEDCMYHGWHTMHTSLINGVDEHDGVVTIETRNSVYTLKEIENNA